MRGRLPFQQRQRGHGPDGGQGSGGAPIVLDSLKVKTRQAWVIGWLGGVVCAGVGSPMSRYLARQSRGGWAPRMRDRCGQQSVLQWPTGQC